MHFTRLFSAFFFSSRRRHTRWPRDWSSDVCSSDLDQISGANVAYFKRGVGLFTNGHFQIKAERVDFSHGLKAGLECSCVAPATVATGVAAAHAPVEIGAGGQILFKIGRAHV